MMRLPPMPKIADIIRLYGLSARKQLSQNFILDLNITDKIARRSGVFDCYVCEVGAGPGSLTRAILQNQARHVAAVEIDDRFLPSLKMLSEASEGRLSVHHGDIMHFNIHGALSNALPVPWDKEDLPGVKLVGNLPFSVSIPLLLQWLAGVSERCGVFRLGRVPMSLVFQKEVAQNILAEPYSKNCSRLTIMTKNLCHTKLLYKLPRQVYVPEPKVDTCLLQFIPKMKPEIDAPFNVVEQVVKAVYSQKRKLISSSLKCLFPGDESLASELLVRAEVEPTLRSYQLDFENYNRLCSAFMNMAEEKNLPIEPLRVNKPPPIVDREITNDLDMSMNV